MDLDPRFWNNVSKYFDDHESIAGASGEKELCTNLTFLGAAGVHERRHRDEREESLEALAEGSIQPSAPI